MERYIISGCKEVADNEVIRVPDSEAEFWSIYENQLDKKSGLILQYAIHDFGSRDAAEYYMLTIY